MHDSGEILNCIYSNSKNPVAAFNLSGSIFWQNKAAEKFFSAGFAEPRVIFSEIVQNNGEEGVIHAGFGGKYHYANLPEGKCCIVELYGEENLIELFNDRRISDYIRQSDSEVRIAVSGIFSLCELINRAGENECNTEIEQYLSKIISYCCLLMKKTTFSSMMAELADGSGYGTKIIDIDSFLIEFTGGCNNAWDNRGSMQIKNKCCGFVRTNKTILTYFLLSLIHLLTLNVKENMHIDITTELRIDEIKVSFELRQSKGSIPTDEEFENDGCFDRNIIDIFAKKIEAEYDISGSCLNVLLKRAEYEGDPIMESSRVSFGDEIFSPYNIMLNDPENHKEFC